MSMLCKNEQKNKNTVGAREWNSVDPGAVFTKSVEKRGSTIHVVDEKCTISNFVSYTKICFYISVDFSSL